MSEKANQIVVVPDIGTDDAVRVIEINVKVGDSVNKEDTLITLESEKASMEIPSPFVGVVSSIEVKLGDSIKSGSKILVLTVVDAAPKTVEDAVVLPSVSILAKPAALPLDKQSDQIKPAIQQKSAEKQSKRTVVVPDIGTDDAVRVIEINVKVGDAVQQEDTLITLESEKASMEIPSPFSGVIDSIDVKIGDLIKSGAKILVLISAEQVAEKIVSKERERETEAEKENNIPKAVLEPQNLETEKKTDNKPVNSGSNLAYASPSVRRFANQLGVNLAQINGTGRKTRILKVDIEQYVKITLNKITEISKLKPGAGSGGISNLPDLSPLPALPTIDFAKYGEITVKSFSDISRIKKLVAANMHRNWLMVPHVTQFDEADITDMESFRDKYKDEARSKGYKLTPLVFLMKAAVGALKALPQFNVSLSNDGENIIQKYYYHIGVAVDTPNGLVVPVIKDVDQKGLFQIAEELATLSQKARDGKLLPKDMQGGCFTISSLGGIGGTAFTPIVNLPEVAILGVSKAKMKPVYQNGEFVPRLMLPLSLSYDHRVIDGADGARFITQFSSLLGDISQLLL